MPLPWHARAVHGLGDLAGHVLGLRRAQPLPEERLVAPEEQLVPIGAGALHTLCWGERGGGAEPVVLLHGLNANARYWGGVASCLLHTGGRPLLAPDLRGHGRTGPLPGGYALAQLRADLLAWLDALDLARVALVGHSWGGKIALDLAAAAPERISRLALVDPVPPDGLSRIFDRRSPAVAAVFAPERGPFADRGALDAAHRTISWLKHAGPWMHRAFDANFVAAADGAIRPVLDDAGFAEIYDSVLRRPSGHPLTPLAGLPLLVVVASFSVVRPRQLRRLRRALPACRVARVPGEHSLHAANPVGLAAELERFLGA